MQHSLNRKYRQGVVSIQQLPHFQGVDAELQKWQDAYGYGQLFSQIGQRQSPETARKLISQTFLNLLLKEIEDQKKAMSDPLVQRVELKEQVCYAKLLQAIGKQKTSQSLKAMGMVLLLREILSKLNETEETKEEGIDYFCMSYKKGSDATTRYYLYVMPHWVEIAWSEVYKIYHTYCEPYDQKDTFSKAFENELKNAHKKVYPIVDFESEYLESPYDHFCFSNGVVIRVNYQKKQCPIEVISPDPKLLLLECSEVLVTQEAIEMALIQNEEQMWYSFPENSHYKWVLEKTLDEWDALEHRQDQTWSNIKALHRCFVYCLLKNADHAGIRVKLLPYLSGPKNTAKSTWINTMEALLGDTTMGVMEMDRLVGQKATNFTGTELGKRIAVINENEGDLTRSKYTSKERALLKKLSGGDSMIAEKKNQEPKKLKRPAKVIIASNDYAPIGDGAIEDRLYFIEFRYDFSQAKRPYHIQKVIQEEGVYLWQLLVSTMKHFIQEGSIHDCPSHLRIKEKRMLDASDIVARWQKQCLIAFTDEDVQEARRKGDHYGGGVTEKELHQHLCIYRAVGESDPKSWEHLWRFYDKGKTPIQHRTKDLLIDIILSNSKTYTGLPTQKQLKKIVVDKGVKDLKTVGRTGFVMYRLLVRFKVPINDLIIE